MISIYFFKCDTFDLDVCPLLINDQKTAHRYKLDTTQLPEQVLVMYISDHRYVGASMAGKCPDGSLNTSSGFTLTDVGTQSWTVVSGCARHDTLTHYIVALSIEDRQDLIHLLPAD